MNLVFDQSFDKKVDKLKNKAAAQKILKIIDICENANNINDIPNIKKMKGYKSFYRIKLGDYRLGIELIANTTIKFITIAHRKEIYNFFP